MLEAVINWITEPTITTRWVYWFTLVVFYRLGVVLNRPSKY